MFFSPKKLLAFIPQRLIKRNTYIFWNFKIAISAIVIISILILVFASFNVISNSLLDHARENSEELIKQTAKNVQTVLEAFDDLAMTISRDNKIANTVLKLESITDERERAENISTIEEVLKEYYQTTQGIEDITVVTNKNTLIICGDRPKSLNTDASSYYPIKTFRESGKKSIWLSTYLSPINSKTDNSENRQVFSIIKGIYSSNSLKSQEMLLVDIKESYLYSLVSNLKFSEESSAFILDSNGGYVMNAKDYKLNGHTADFDFIREILDKKSGDDIRKINGKNCVVTYTTVDEIKGTDLGWTIVNITPVASITKEVTSVKTYLSLISLLSIILGLALADVFTRIYNSSLDKRYAERNSIAMEKERLASLGQMIGGIAHNFKTPIMSVAGGLEAINDLIDEYDRSIGDSDVTPEDHHEIASEITQWVEKIKPYCDYMSDIISAVKGQTANFNDSTNQSFTVEELIKRVKILMSHELKKNKSTLNVDINVDEKTIISGEINNLVQILNNLISNSIEAYNGEGGKVDLIISRKGDNIEIVERDYGCGIPENIRRRLLKEMITTKGKNGTGLGLYMSYSTIKGKFGGTMSIESEEGKGTSIIMSIPYTGK